MIRALCGLLLVVASLGGNATARADGERPLTEADVVASVAQHHPRLLVEASRVAVAAAEVRAARGAFDPQLAIRADGQLTGYYDYGRMEVMLEQTTPYGGLAVFGGYRFDRGTLPSYYGLWDTLELGEVRAGVRMPLLRDLRIDDARGNRARTGYEEEAAQLMQRSVALQLVRDARLAYRRWVAAGSSLAVAESLLELARSRDAQVRRLADEGAVASIEAVENQRALLQREARRIAAEQRLGQAAVMLSLFLRDEEGLPRVPGRAELPPEAGAPPSGLPTADEAYALAVANRPEVARYDVLIERARLQQRLARNGRLPRLDVRATVSRDLGGAVSSSQEQRLAGTIVEGNVQLLSPIPNRTGSARVEARAAEIDGIEAERRFFLEQLRAEVERALLDAAAAEASIGIERQAASVAETLAAAEMRRFETGATSLLIVNLREQAAADARISVVEREAEVFAARAVLEAVIGQLPASYSDP